MFWNNRISELLKKLSSQN